MNNLPIILVICLIVFACGGGNSSDVRVNENSGIESMAPVAKNYLNEVISLMRNHAITKNEIDWGSLESEVNALAANSQTIPETYPAIVKALELLNTNHTFLVNNLGETVAFVSDIVCKDEFELDEPVVSGIGYIRVDEFLSTDDGGALQFAKKIQQDIANQDSAEITGWVVDLRNNSGGNMWPMIAGLGPLMGEGTHGYFIDADELITEWGYNDGTAYANNIDVVTIEEPYVIVNPVSKVAVLSSQRVASSGEAVLIGFKKQTNVRIFGQDSCGLSTANRLFELSDGSRLFLTTSVMADREQKKYGGIVTVDQSESIEETLNKALDWLSL